MNDFEEFDLDRWQGKTPEPIKRGRPRKSKPPAIEQWPAIRKRIMDRDDYVCRICFKASGEAELHVHHIDYERSNNNDQNLVTLCRGCHKQVHDEQYKPAEHPDWPTPWQVDW